jgi:hypothetical protein
MKFAKLSNTSDKLKNWFNTLPWDNRGFVILLLFLTYFLFTGIRFILFSLAQEPLIQADELLYKGMAYSFFETGDFYKLNYGLVGRPNYLYQLLLFPAFYFNDNFLIFIKLVNSLLVNSMIFPCFLLMREFINYKKAYLTSVLILLIPFINIGGQVMPESLFLPLFLFAFYFSYKLFIDLKFKYGILTGVTFALLYLTKPHAAASVFFFVLMSLIIVMVERNEPKKRKRITFLAFVAVANTFLGVVLLNLIFRGEAGISNMFLGYSWLSKKFVLIDSLKFIFSTKFLNLLLGHFSSFFLVYLVPFLVSIYALLKFIKEKRQKEVIFLSMGLGLLFAYFAMTIKFTLDIVHIDDLARCHVRYYFMVFPFFIIAFACFYKEIKWTFYKKVIMGILFIITLLTNILIFLPKFTIFGVRGTIIDNIDTTWIRHLYHLEIFKIFFFSMLVFLLGIIIYYLGRRNKSRVPYYLFFVIISLLANIGYIKMSIHYSKQMSNSKIYRTFIKDKILSFPEKVFLIGPKDQIVMMCNIAFWLPYRYTDNLLQGVPKNFTISKKMIRGDPGWIVMFGKYELEPLFSKSHQKYIKMPMHGRRIKCTIIRLSNPAKAKNKKIQND